MSEDRARGVRVIRLAIVLQIAGLLFAGLIVVTTHPLAVVTFAAVGAPLIILGAAIYVFQILRELARRGSL